MRKFKSFGLAIMTALFIAGCSSSENKIEQSSVQQLYKLLKTIYKTVAIHKLFVI